jgi:hypothetical protein
LGSWHLDRDDDGGGFGHYLRGGLQLLTAGLGIFIPEAVCGNVVNGA